MRSCEVKQEIGPFVMFMAMGPNYQRGVRGLNWRRGFRFGNFNRAPGNIASSANACLQVFKRDASAWFNHLKNSIQERLKIPTAVPQNQIRGENGIEVCQRKVNIPLVPTTTRVGGIFHLVLMHVKHGWKTFASHPQLALVLPQHRGGWCKEHQGWGNCPEEEPPTLMDHFHGVASFAIQCQQCLLCRVRICRKWRCDPRSNGSMARIFMRHMVD